MSKINRRQFIASAGVASLSLAATPSAAKLAEHLGDRDVKDIPEKVPSLAIKESIAHQSGVPLGGIGAGSVEIRSDGYFHDWLIFNMGSWAPNLPKEERGPAPDMGPGALSFFLRTKQPGKEPQLRRLGIREDQNDLYSLGWAKNVQAVEYDGVFPRASLHYHDESLPVEVRSEFFGPFIAHDSKTSGTPGFHGLFTITNHGKEAVEVSLLSSLKNPVAVGDPDRKLRNEIHSDQTSAMLTMRTEAAGPRKSTLGSMSFSLNGGKPSWILADFDGFVSNGQWFGGPHYGTVQDSYLRRFREKGVLPNLTGDTCPASELRMSDEEIAKLAASDKDAIISKLSQYPSFAAFVERVKQVQSSELQSEEGKTRVLQALRHRLDQLAGRERKEDYFGNGALCSTVQLAPGQSKTITFALAWYFPHHFSGDGREMGHAYEGWFEDAAAVNRFLLANSQEHAAKVRGFVTNLGDTSLPPELASSWTEQLSTLTKCTWWTRAGRFGVWEGLGCCGFHTMDITYQGSFSILALFPDLQLTQMKMGAEYQRADGRVAHFFTPDLMHVDNGFDRVDMNPQFVMLACRDYLWTGDKAYLERVFPHVARAIENSADLDSNGDGLPDRETRRNTYDNWNFFGTPSYISSLWLGSLLAGERMARDLGKNDLADQWKAIRDKGQQSFESLLWNGEYYSLWVDKNEKDECCMSDQLSGVWFSHLVGLGQTLPAERVRAALQAVCRHNFSSETGLQNATYPEGRQPKFSTHMNAQATACWTGVEYAFASMLFDFGMLEEALAIVQCVGERYRRTGRIWNHVECGDHYYRAMCSWSTLLGATGFKVDVPNATLSILPKQSGDLKAPWVSSTGWGSLNLVKRRLTLSCHSGTMSLSELRVPVGLRVSGAKLNGDTLQLKAEDREGYRALTFERPVRLEAGNTFELSV